MNVVDDSCLVLASLGAPARLVTHGRLVSEAAAQLLDVLAEARVVVDTSWVLAGAVLHDAGKSLYPGELDGPGHSHEAAGEELLLRHGVAAHVARCCRSHAAWRDAATLEELLVALADKLWKGVRVLELERLVIDRLTAASGAPAWDAFVRFDSAFEEIASGSGDRLARSHM